MMEEILKEKDEAMFDLKFDDLFREASEHNNNEEVEDLVFVSENASAETREEAAKKFSFRKKIAPTRPHPEIPNKSVGLETALGLLVAPIDKIKDMFTSFPSEAELDKVEEELPSK